MCEKERYVDEYVARFKLYDIQNQRSRKSYRNKDNVEIRYYYCRNCSGYHLTSKPYDPYKRMQR